MQLVPAEIHRTTGHAGVLPPPSTLPAPLPRPTPTAPKHQMPDLGALHISSRHPLDLGSLTDAQSDLWASLPPAYQRFLRVSNGGHVNGGQGGLCFRTGVPYHDGAEVVSRSQIDEVEEFLGFAPASDPAGRASDLVAAKAAHDRAGFLPFGILAIATCCGGSLVCISILPDDFGAIYFWDYYWDYPWSEDFFSRRILAAERQFSDIDEIRADPEHPRRRAAADAINHSVLIRLASDFDTWVESCWWDETPSLDGSARPRKTSLVLPHRRRGSA
jgi:hypothetical protein